MSRYTIQVEINNTEDYFDVIYGFDTGGLLGEQSPTFGFFLQSWLITECGMKELTYAETGDKSAITESPFWNEILKQNEEHALAIALDTIF